MNHTLVQGDHLPALQPHGSAVGGGESPISDRVAVNSVRLTRPRRALQGAFRDFQAEIDGTTGTGDAVVIGTISGCVSWLEWLPEVLDDNRLVDSFAELITAARDTRDVLSADPDSQILGVLLIDKVRLDPPWRGHRLGRTIAEQLIDLLLLTPENTLVLAYFEPEEAPGPARESWEAGGDGRADFEQWRTSRTWWLRPTTPGRTTPLRP